MFTLRLYIAGGALLGLALSHGMVWFKTRQIVLEQWRVAELKSENEKLKTEKFALEDQLVLTRKVNATLEQEKQRHEEIIEEYKTERARAKPDDRCLLSDGDKRRLRAIGN